MTEVFKRTKTYTEFISLQGVALSRYERARERISETLARDWDFVIMPNHFHAIIRIGENEFNTQRRDAMHSVSTTTTDKGDINSPQNKFGPQSKNLASIIRGFKSSVTRKARKIRLDFQWQSRFHDQVIRDEKSLNTISEYIRYNPANWEADKFFQHK